MTTVASRSLAKRLSPVSFLGFLGFVAVVVGVE
jgi:hypothetical protein